MASNIFAHHPVGPWAPVAPPQPAGPHGEAPPGFDKDYDEITTTRTRFRRFAGGYKRYVTSDSLRTFPDNDEEPFRTLVDADGRTTYERVPRRANGASSAPAIIPEPRATSGRALQREETLIAPQQALGPQRAPVLQQAPVPQQSPVTVRRMPAALAGRDEDAMAISQPTTPIPPLRITDDRAVAQFMRSAAADDFVAETRAAITARIAAAARDEDPFSLPVDALPPPPYTEGAGPSNNAAAPSNPQDIARRRDERRARTNQITARRTAAAAASSSRRTSTGGSTSRRAAASTSEQRVEYIIVDD